VQASFLNAGTQAETAHHLTREALAVRMESLDESECTPGVCVGDVEGSYGAL